jgi:hypothetical protein
MAFKTNCRNRFYEHNRWEHRISGAVKLLREVLKILLVHRTVRLISNTPSGMVSISLFARTIMRIKCVML